MVRWLSRCVALAAMIALPVAAAFTGGAKLVPFLAMPLIVLGVPMVMGIRGGADPGTEADSDDGGGSDDGPGGNKRPDRGPRTPPGPRGELPLEFSRPARWRSRGNGQQRTADPGHRRGPHRPVRPPRRSPAGPRRH